jgi:hypothetical protein
MKRIFFPLLAVLIFLSGCGGDKKKAFDFNQKLAKISETLNAKGQVLGNQLKTAMETSKDFSSVAASCKDLHSYIDDKLAELKGMKDISGSENLRNAMISFLNFEKEMVTEAFDPFGRMDSNTTEEEMQTAVNNMLEKTQEESTYLMKVQNAQREYASKNGFKIEDAKK